MIWSVHGVARTGNMDYEKGRYQKVRGFRDMDMAFDGTNAILWLV